MEKTNKKDTQMRLDNTYKVLIVNDEDLKEVKNFRVTLRKFYVLLILGLFALILLVTAIIFLTPIKRLVPGYGELNSNTAFIDLTNQIKDLEEQVENQRIYTEGFKTMIENLDADTELSLAKEGNTISTSSLSSTLSKLDQKYLIAPVKGTISNEFDLEDEHFGVDVIAPKDEPIVAVLDGVVIQSDWSLRDGNSISVLHPDNLISRYQHTSVLLKEAGAKVKAGEAIAIIGNSGEQSDGPHLHFELWFEGEAVDPAQFILF